MSRELLQQALDALETIPAGGADLNQLALTVAGVTLALRAALAAPQGEPVKGAVWHKGSVSLLSVGHEDAYCARRGAQRLYLHPPAAPSVDPTTDPETLRLARLAIANTVDFSVEDREKWAARLIDSTQPAAPSGKGAK